MTILTLDPKQIAAVLRSERPERDGTRWADGACDEWSTVALAFRRALVRAGLRAEDADAFMDACHE